MTQDPLRLLRSLNWLALDGAALSPSLRDWLMEEDSMTRRFEQHCQKVRVEPVREGFIHADELGDEGALLPADQRFWLREVILYGDEQPWLENDKPRLGDYRRELIGQIKEALQRGGEKRQ